MIKFQERGESRARGCGVDLVDVRMTHGLR